MPKKILCNSWLDRLGLSLSAICAAHCLLLPLAFIILPFASHGDHEHSFHEAMIWISMIIVGFLMVRSLRLKLSLRTILAMGIGLLFLLSGHFLETSHNQILGSTATVVGSVCLGWAHYRNLRTHQNCTMRVMEQSPHQMDS